MSSVRERIAHLGDFTLGPRVLRMVAWAVPIGAAGALAAWALLRLIGGPLLILSFVMQLIGVYKNGEGLSGLFTLPEAAWELSLGIYCAWKGFRPSSPIVEPDLVVT